jgi:uncharacterized membrane protein YedE/YeeE
MKVKITGLLGGIVFGFLVSWARVSEPAVIRDMLLLRDAHVFLIMGSAIVVAAIGLRLLRLAGTHAYVTGEPIAWSLHRPERRHVVGSMIFGAGWSVAGTCPAPVAAMIGEGRLSGLAVAAGLLAGVALQPTIVSRITFERQAAAPLHPVGL